MTQKTITATQVAQRIRERINVPWKEPTRDPFIAGDPDKPVTGIATTMFPTMAALRQAADAGLNMVIPHEPTFFHGEDDISQIAGDSVLKAKQTLIAQRGLVIWRFHDHLHRRKPDGINAGMITALGWEGKQIGAADGYEPKFAIPPTTLRELAADLKRRLGARCVRVVGDPEMRCSRAGLAAGAQHSLSQMKLLAGEDVDVLVAGETREWETVEYARDAAAAGQRKALILLGHNVSEEAGMCWAAQWLGTFVSEVPVRFIASGEPYWAA
jgi:putative NIF3 family GTP cyclohydrolase 1 type 2